MRGIDLLRRKARDMLRHGLAEMRRQGLISQRLDKQRRNLNLSIKNSKLLLGVDLASAIPVDCDKVSTDAQSLGNAIRGP